MGRLQRTWQLGKVSWHVLRSDKTLAVFPVLTAVAAVVVVAGFGALIGTLGIESTATGDALAPIGWVLIVALYVVVAIVVTFFQVALCAGANERLDGRDATVGGALGAAGAHLPSVIGWGLLQGIVSAILSALEDRGILGDIVAAIAGTAWRIATFLALPVIAVEGTGPIASVKRSGSLLKSTWGENVFGQAGFGLLGLVASLPGIALIVLGVAVVWPFAVVGVLWLVVVSVVVSAMTGIYKTALYRYATGAGTPAGFASTDLADAFVAKPAGGRR